MPLPINVKRALQVEPSNQMLYVYNRTANLTMTQSQTGSVITNLGAAGAVTITLPPSPKKGTNFFFGVSTAQELRINPGSSSDLLIINGAAQTAGKYAGADDEGETAKVVYIGSNKWLVDAVGTWTVES